MKFLWNLNVFSSTAKCSFWMLMLWKAYVHLTLIYLFTLLKTFVYTEYIFPFYWATFPLFFTENTLDGCRFFALASHVFCCVSRMTQHFKNAAQMLNGVQLLKKTLHFFYSTNPHLIFVTAKTHSVWTSPKYGNLNISSDKEIDIWSKYTTDF